MLTYRIGKDGIILEKLIDMFQNLKLYLISNSPRRKSILEDVGISPMIGKVEVEENYPSALSIIKAPAYLAAKKVKAFQNSLEFDADNYWFLGADTMVIFDGKELGKPATESEAKEILKVLSGREHQVVTGFYLSKGKHIFQGESVTNVVFKTLSDEMITHYIQKYQPYDKAGAYGIQEWIGKVGIEKIEGDFYGVMGLPVSMIIEKIIAIEEEN